MLEIPFVQRTSTDQEHGECTLFAKLHKPTKRIFTAGMTVALMPTLRCSDVAVTHSLRQQGAFQIAFKRTPNCHVRRMRR
jgi:hypothetical protein